MLNNIKKCLPILISFLVICFSSCKTNVETKVDTITENVVVTNVTVSYISDQGMNYNKQNKFSEGYRITHNDLPDLTSDDYNFIGWFCNGEQVKPGFLVNKDCVFIAKWEKYNSTITIDSVSNFTVNKGNSKAILKWTNPSDENFLYNELKMSPAEGSLSNPIILNKEISNFKIEGLSAGSYSFYITSFDALHNSSSTISRSVSISENEQDTTSPSRVSNLSVEAQNGTAVVNWTNPSDPDLQYIKLNLNPTTELFSNPILLNKDVTNFTITNLTNDTYYSLYVYAIDENLNESSYSYLRFRPEDTSDHNAPSEVTDVNITQNNREFTFSWKNPTDEDFNGVQLSLYYPEQQLEQPIILGKDVTEFKISNLIPRGSFSQKITIKTLDNNFNFSKGVTKYVNVQYDEIIKPENISSITHQNGTDNGEVILNWTDPFDDSVEGIEFRANPNDGLLKNSIVVKKGIPKLLVTGLQPETSYRIYYKTFNKDKVFSDEKHYDFKTRRLIEKPVTYPISSISYSEEGDNVEVRWSVSSNQEDTEISLDPPAGNLLQPIILNYGRRDFIITGMEKQKSYTVKLRAYNRDNKEFSEYTTKDVIIRDTSNHPRPSEVDSLNLKENINGYVNITWRNPSSSFEENQIRGIELEISPNPYNDSGIYKVTLGANCTNYCLTNLKENVKYTFTFKTFSQYHVYSYPTSFDVIPGTFIKNPTSEISNLQYTLGNKDISFTWTDPSDINLKGIEIYYTTASKNRSFEPLNKDSIVIYPGVQKAIFRDLDIKTIYNFTFKVINNYGLKSNGYNVSIQPKVNPLNLVDKVIISAKADELDTNDVIQLSTTTTDANIFYTIDGSDPLVNGVLYNPKNPILFPEKENCIVKAYAHKDGLIDSEVSSKSFTRAKYSVKFNTNGIGNAPQVITNLIKGDVITTEQLRFSLPENSGYKFIHWLDENNNPILTSYKVKSNVELKADLQDMIPSAITNLKAVKGNEIITLSWDKLNEEDLDRIVITSPTLSEKTVPATDTSIVIDNLKYGNTYSFTLKVIDKGNNESKTTSVLQGTKALYKDYITTDSPISIGTKTYGDKTYDMIKFGDYPKSIKPSDVIIDESYTKKINGFDCVIGENGVWYYKATYDNQKYNEHRSEYFKIEPIIWRVLTDNYNDTSHKLLLTDNSLTYSTYNSYKQDDKYLRKYETSKIRTYLNQEFLNCAFSDKGKSLICDTTVDNSAKSTYSFNYVGDIKNPYSSKNTIDKIFLLSAEEVTNPSYGFGQKDQILLTRMIRRTEYAHFINGSYADVNKPIDWFTRSPSIITTTNTDDEIFVVGSDGTTNTNYPGIEKDTGLLPNIYSSYDDKAAVVPALVIKY